MIGYVKKGSAYSYQRKVAHILGLSKCNLIQAIIFSHSPLRYHQVKDASHPQRRHWPGGLCLPTPDAYECFGYHDINP